MNITSAIFECSAPDLDACPDESLPEFAFIGRSNVGKSSLLNLLAGQNGLARTSPTPGFTKLINFFTMNQTWRLVDLPGYGFAEGAKKASAKFNRAVMNYLEHRPNLSLVFALIDSELPPQEMDVEFIGWLAHNAVPFVLVFTKTDKCPPAVVAANIAAFNDRIAEWFTQPPASFRCSATAKHGRHELLAVIDELLVAIQAESAPLANDAETADEISPGPKKKLKQLPKRRPDIDAARPW